MEALQPDDFAALNRMLYNYRRYLLSGIRSEYRNRRRGSSLDFYDFKDYALGDDPRHINWKTYVRHQKLYTKTFHEEVYFYLHVLVDNSRSMTLLPEKIDAAIRFACAMAYIALALRLPVEIELLCKHPHHENHFSGKNWRAIARFLQTAMAPESAASGKKTARAEADHTEVENLIASTGEYVHQHARKSGIIIFVSDFLYGAEAMAQLCKKLLNANFEIRPVQIIAAQERNPRLGEAALPVVLIDSETGEEQILQFAAEDYQASYNHHLAAIANVLEKNRLPILRIHSDESVVMFIRQHLLKLGLVR